MLRDAAGSEEGARRAGAAGGGKLVRLGEKAAVRFSFKVFEALSFG